MLTKKFDPKANSIFITHSLGIATARDAWVCNSSKGNLMENMKKTIGFFNEQSGAFAAALKENPSLKFDSYASTDATQNKLE